MNRSQDLRNYLCISFCLIGTLLAGPAISETEPQAPMQGDQAASAETAPHQPEQIPQQAAPAHPIEAPLSPTQNPPAQTVEWQVPAQMLYHAAGTGGSFLDERRAIVNALASALGKPAAQWGVSADMSNALLALARLHYRHAQGPEGLSVLDGLDRANLTGTQELRRAVLELALGVVDPRDIGLTERAQALLGPAYNDWPDQTVFAVLQHIRNNRFDQVGDLLPEVHDRISRFPMRYQAIILPGLLEAAIVSENWRVARDFALEFRKHPGLTKGSAFQYLLGRAAEAGGDLLAAFDSYTLASAQHNLYGHRARTAVISLALRHDLMDIPEARALLQRETQIWRGDDYAMSVLTDLAALDRADGDRVAAVYTYGSILDRFPEHQEAGLARQKARALITEIYDEGAAGTLPLASFLIAHRKISPDYRFEPGFDAQGERFADRFLAAGSTLIAAQEYEAVHDHLAVARDLG